MKEIQIFEGSFLAVLVPVYSIKKQEKMLCFCSISALYAETAAQGKAGGVGSGTGLSG